MRKLLLILVSVMLFSLVGKGQYSDGKKLQTPDGKIYIIMEGKKRYIPNSSVYKGLFKDNPGDNVFRIGHDELNRIPDGGAIGDNAWLAKDDSGRIWFLEWDYRRHIANSATLNKYRFRTPSSVTKSHILEDWKVKEKLN